MYLNRVLCLLLTFAILCIAYEQVVQDAIATGEQYLRSIPPADQTTDSYPKCDIEAKLAFDRGVSQRPRGSVNIMIQKVDLPNNSKWTPMDAVYPKYPKPDPISTAKTKYLCTYNPDGAILYNDISVDRFDNAGPGYSAADVSWTLYKRICDADQGAQEDRGRYNNIKYIACSNVVADGSSQVFETFLPVQDQLQTFTKAGNWDAFRAFMGLNNGKVVKDLLTYHNQEMGRKQIKEVQAWRATNNKNYLVWVLEDWVPGTLP